MIEERVTGFHSYRLVLNHHDGDSETVDENMTHAEAWKLARDVWDHEIFAVSVTIQNEQNGIKTVPLFCDPPYYCPDRVRITA